MPLESPKGDAQRPVAIVAAARGCGWRCGCACPNGRLRDRPRRRGTALLLVANIVLALVLGCEEGLEIRTGAI